MKILSLNVWHGECGHLLKEYLASLLDDVDVFCFQESNGKAIEPILAELFGTSRFSSVTSTKHTESGRHYHLTTAVREPYEILRSDSLFNDTDVETGQALAASIKVNDTTMMQIVNVHGVPFKIDDKLDTEGRLRQTERIVSWSKEYATPTVVCGDFNLLPEAKSITNFSAAGFRNLISDYSVPTTRNRLAWNRFPDNKQYFADYTFASPGTRIVAFDVPATEVSDHLPMITELAI